MGPNIERLEKGYKYFWDLKASEFNAGHKVILTEYLKLVKVMIDDYKDNQLFKKGEKIFNETI